MLIRIKSKLTIFLALTLFVLNFGFIFPDRASAIDTANWKDGNDITYKSREFRDEVPFDNNVNFSDIGPDGCEDEIKGFENRGDATVEYLNRYRQSGGDCQEETEALSLGNRENRFIFFRFVDGGTIEAAIGQLDREFGQFSRIDGEPNNKYFRDGEASRDCQDVIEVGGSGPNGTVQGVLIEHTGGTTGNGNNSGYGSCQFIGTVANNSHYTHMYDQDRDNDAQGVQMYISQVENRSIPAGTGGGGGDGNGEEAPPSCESENTEVLDWILCGTINAIDKVLIGKNGTGGLFGEVEDLLNISDQYYSDESLQKAWSYFRNIASLALVLIGLIMVVGQAMSKE